MIAELTLIGLAALLCLLLCHDHDAPTIQRDDDTLDLTGYHITRRK